MYPNINFSPFSCSAGALPWTARQSGVGGGGGAGAAPRHGRVSHGGPGPGLQSLAEAVQRGGPAPGLDTQLQLPLAVTPAVTSGTFSPPYSTKYMHNKSVVRFIQRFRSY